VSKVTLPGGQVIELHDLSSRQLLVPVGTTVRIPIGHEWTITSMSAPPVRGYVPPVGSETRNSHEWGDVQIRVDDLPNAQFRTSALTLMDRYWGRYNLSPELPDLVAKLTQAQHALITAPKISELLLLVDRTTVALHTYLQAAAPAFPTPITVTGNQRFTVEIVDCEGAVEHYMARTLDVELLVLMQRPVS
jgi:hypothetical protein